MKHYGRHLRSRLSANWDGTFMQRYLDCVPGHSFRYSSGQPALFKEWRRPVLCLVPGAVD